MQTPPLDPFWGAGREPQPFVHPLDVGLQKASTPSSPALDDSPRLEISFRHSGWATNRHHVWQAFLALGVADNRLNAFASCGMHAFVEESVEDPGHYRVRCARCHDRFCLPCAQERSRVIAANLRDYVQHRRLRFVTLTLRSTDDLLDDLVEKLYRSFSQLRRSALWRKCVRGGAAFCEVRWCVETQRWHPHLHILCEGKFLAQKALAEVWHRVTGDSYIVDVRAAGDVDRVSAYVVKYASKPLDPSFLAIRERLQEAVRALGGRRLCLTVGSWTDLRLLEVRPVGTWAPVASLTALLRAAQAGDAEARAILDAISRHPLPATCQEPPDEAPPTYG